VFNEIGDSFSKTDYIGLEHTRRKTAIRSSTKNYINNILIKACYCLDSPHSPPSINLKPPGVDSMRNVQRRNCASATGSALLNMHLHMTFWPSFTLLPKIHLFNGFNSRYLFATRNSYFGYRHCMRDKPQP
jgi:hypothetical protein